MVDQRHIILGSIFLTASLASKCTPDKTKCNQQDKIQDKSFTFYLFTPGGIQDVLCEWILCKIRAEIIQRVLR